MAAFINNDITTAGLIVLAKGVAGQKINYTKIVLGDGYLEEGQTPRTLTGVVSPKAVSYTHLDVYKRQIRDYARAFHTSTRDLGERRLTDFLTEYGEAVEEAKRFQASRPTRAASFKKPHIRRR